MPSSEAENFRGKDDEKYMTRPVPGRHTVDDEYIDSKKCSNRKENSDHFWHTNSTVKKPWDIRDNRVFYCIGVDDD